MRFWQVNGVMHADAEGWAYLAVRISRLVRIEAQVNGSWPAGLLAFVGEAEAARRAIELQSLSSAKADPTPLGRVEEVSAREAAEALHCSVQWARHLASRGQITGRKVGREWLIDRASLDRQTPKAAA